MMHSLANERPHISSFATYFSNGRDHASDMCQTLGQLPGNPLAIAKVALLRSIEMCCSVAALKACLEPRFGVFMHPYLASCLAQDETFIASELQRFVSDSIHECRNIAQDSISDIRIAEDFEVILTGLFNQPGKRVRPLLACWMARNFSEDFLKINKDKHQIFFRIAAAVEVLHTASLVIDDIEDGSTQRRGSPALHIEFGTARAMNLGSWLFFAALRYLNNPVLLEIGCKVLFDCHVGQGLDVGQHTLSAVQAVFSANPSGRQSYYMTCARLKTARLMEFVVECGSNVLKQSPENTQKISRAFTLYGTAFQILDDVRNFFPTLSGTKAFEDLNCGIRNYVCIELLNQLSTTDNNRACEIYFKKEFEPFVLNHEGLPRAIQKSIQKTESLLEEAQYILAAVCTNVESKNYLHYILEKPLVELKNAIIEKSTPLNERLV